MLPPALTPQPHRQEQHQLGAGMENSSQSRGAGGHLASGVAKLVSRTGRNNGEHFQMPPLLHILQVTLWPVLGGMRRLTGITERCFPQPRWLLPSQRSHRYTPAPECHGWQPLQLPLSPKPAWRAFPAPTGPGHTGSLSTIQPRQGSELCFEGLRTQKNHPQALGRSPYQNLQPQQQSWVPSAQRCVQGASCKDKPASSPIPSPLSRTDLLADRAANGGKKSLPGWFGLDLVDSGSLALPVSSFTILRCSSSLLRWLQLCSTQESLSWAVESRGTDVSS